MNKSSLLERIRSLQREIDGLMDMVIAMEDAPLPVFQEEEAFNDKWLTVRQVCEFLNISRTTFYEGVRRGIFPAGNVFGPKTIRWRISDIAAWRAKQVAHQEPIEPPHRRGRPSRIRKEEFCYV